MKREVVQNLLNLPGVVGVALMDGRSRPYFCGIDQALNFQQKEALAQGIQQVVETTPSGFKFFEFQFTGHQVYIYKLERSIILLVLTSHELSLDKYLEAIDELKGEIQDDAVNAIATFRLLAGNVTLSNQTYWKRRSESNSTGNKTVSPTATPSPIPASQNGSASPTPPPTSAPPPPPPPPPPPSPPPSPSPEVSVSPPPKSPELPEILAKPVSMADLLAALNHFSQFTTQYLGPTVVTNYWKTTRPAVDWLNHFQIDRSAHITFSGTPTSSTTPTLDDEQHQWVKDWVAVFIQRCSKVIRDFPSITRQRALDDLQKALLLTEDI